MSMPWTAEARLTDENAPEAGDAMDGRATADGSSAAAVGSSESAATAAKVERVIRVGAVGVEGSASSSPMYAPSGGPRT